MTKLPTLNCPHFAKCSGCELEKDLESIPVLKDIEGFAQNHSASFSFHSGKLNGWRIRSKLAVRGYHFPKIGLFQRNSHVVEEIPNCVVHHPLINKATNFVKQGLKDFVVSGYDEAKQKGLVRYVQFLVDEKTQKVQLSLVIFSKTIPENLEKLIDQWKSLDIWHSVWINFHSEPTNRIFSEDWHLCFGPKYLELDLFSTRLYFHPACFVQANFSLFEKMVGSIREKITPSQSVVELYAGSGSIGFSVVDRSQKVLCIDNNLFAEECFQKTKENLSSPTQEKISYKLGDAGKLGDLALDAEVLILDPPRKGIDPVLFPIIEKSSAKQIFYVSCFWKSCQRDVEQLIKLGWKISSIESYLFFPGTSHIEVLCVLTRTP